MKSSRRPSVMTHQFSQVPRAEIPRSTFDRSHGHKTTFDAGYLIPFYVDEALPGDTFNCRVTALARLATPIFPLMDNMFLDTFFFAVPYRLIWDNWEKFNGAQDNPTDGIDYLAPYMTSPSGGFANGSIHDYMGIPTGIANLKVSTLWHRAYNLIWNEWFRDQNLQDSVPVPKTDGTEDSAKYVLLRRGKRHDYFTSCLPWPQKGPGVTLPLGTVAPVWGSGENTPFMYTTNSSGLPAVPGTQAYTKISNATNTPLVMNANSAPTENALYHMSREGYDSFGYQNPPLVADLSTAASATINSLRQAFQIQKIYERDARGGTRYTELIKSHFGVTSPDARLQRPEYLGGGTTPVNVTPIPQTSASGTYADSPQGNLAAVGVATINQNGFTHSFTEHCIVIGLVSCRADLTYQQGLNRMFSRETRFDYYWPALSHIGEQAVLRKEIYANGTTDDDIVFGYQERFAEYRYKPSLITGLFRSTHATPLDAWHLSQEFTTAPVLDASFIEENPPIDRVIAVQSEPHFLFDSFIQLRCARPMPVYGVPGLMDHF